MPWDLVRPRYLAGASNWIVMVARVDLRLSTGTFFATRQERELRRVYNALRETELRHRIAADTVPVMIWRSGLDGHCDFFNPAWLIFTGRSAAQELGDGWIEGVHADDLDRYMVTYCTAFNARTPFRLEHRLRQFDGEYRWVLNTGIPRWDKDGTFAGYIGSCVELTDRTIADRLYENSHAELGRVSRFAALGEFAALIAHELRQRLRRHGSQSHST